jgi:hypothetical protein
MLDDKLISTDTTITQADASKALEAASFLPDLGKRILKEKYLLHPASGRHIV